MTNEERQFKACSIAVDFLRDTSYFAQKLKLELLPGSPNYQAAMVAIDHLRKATDLLARIHRSL